MTKTQAQKQRLTLNREQFMMVVPRWCYGRHDGWASLVDRWLGDDAEFAAKSIKAQANRGKDGTHGQGNRNHWGFKAMKEDKLKRPLSDIESWKLARERSDPKDGECQYYGKTEEHLESYTQNYQKLHPDVPVPEVARSQIDDTAVVAIQGKSHGRYPCFDGLITPSISYTRLRATNPSQLESTGRSQTPLARQHAISTSPLSFSL
nr:uncharacterized protein LOC109748221 [Aegilops tauschii subsp. strangulata]